jgi:uncharacterized protein YeaO (DUF488 family)
MLVRAYSTELHLQKLKNTDIIRHVPLRTRRWNDAPRPDDGLRVLICRYRPRGLPKREETWDEWRKELGPSPELLADFHGKRRAPISWTEYRKRYLEEMRQQSASIEELAGTLIAGETVTLLCSSACIDPERCHRTLLQKLIEARVRRGSRRREPFIERHAPNRHRGRARVP